MWDPRASLEVFVGYLTTHKIASVSFKENTSKNEQPNKNKATGIRDIKTKLFVPNLLTTDYKYVIISTLEHSVSKSSF